MPFHAIYVPFLGTLAILYRLAPGTFRINLIMRFIWAQKQVSTIFTCRDRIFGFCARRKWFFAIYAKTEGPRLKSCITSINKLDNCGSFEPKYKSLRPSGAEIIFWPNFGWAWPILAENGRKKFGTLSYYVYNMEIGVLTNFHHSKYFCSKQPLFCPYILYY